MGELPSPSHPASPTVCGRKSEYPERTHRYTGKTYTFCAERPHFGIQTLNLMQGNSANYFFIHISTIVMNRDQKMLLTNEKKIEINELFIDFFYYYYFNNAIQKGGTHVDLMHKVLYFTSDTDVGREDCSHKVGSMKLSHGAILHNCLSGSLVCTWCKIWMQLLGHESMFNEVLYTLFFQADLNTQRACCLQTTADLCTTCTT